MGPPILAVLAVLAASCKSAPRVKVPPKEAKPLAVAGEGAEREASSPNPLAETLPWEESTFSPRPGSSPEPRLDGVAQTCGAGDASLHEVAQWLAAHFTEHQKSTSIDYANFHLRRAGVPYVMPRLWSAQMSEIDESAIGASVSEWAQQRESVGEYRCGVGAARLEDGTFGVIAIQADVLADLAPLPTAVEPGTWLDLSATLLVPGNEATVLLLPPEGMPRRLRTQLDGASVKARFPIETEGTWMVQLMATVSGGPRPVAQMFVTAGTHRPQAPDERPVPGEEGVEDDAAFDDALFAAINAARDDQGLPQVKRNRRLDVIARAHSDVMMKQGRISHDTGAGNPAYRVESAGIRPKATGENVALAASVVRLHRALWNSPSHRENMLLRRWDEVGVAVVLGGDQLLYATQLYIDSD